MVTGIGLISGGLDSILAARILMEQGIRVIGISFKTPFFGPARAVRASEKIGFELRVEDISQEHIEMVRNPKHGYGKNMNPCIDCHGLMFRHAGRIMESEGADFLFSGEVLDERPMSQNYRSLMVVAEESAYAEYIIRPLSAKLLPASKPEKEGKVDRERFLDIRGRSRKRQMELAKEFGITDYPSPAGGCLLTEVGFSKRLKDLFEHGKEASVRDVELLRFGRHMRLSEKAKVIVGRNEQENNEISARAGTEDIVIEATGYPGPIGVICGQAEEEIIKRACAICARYSDAPKDAEVSVAVKGGGREGQVLVRVADEEEMRGLLI